MAPARIQSVVSHRVQAWIAALGDGNVTRRLRALKTLQRGSARSVDRALVRALRNQNPDVRSGVVACLGKRGRLNLRLARRAMRDPDAGVRENTAWALGTLRGAGVVDLLASTLRVERSVDIRISALGSLRMIASRRAIPALIFAARSRSAQVRIGALRALQELRDPVARPVLRRASQDAVAEVRAVALDAVAHGCAGTGDDGVVEALSFGDELTVRAALRALAQVGTPRAVGPAVLALANPDVAEDAAEALLSILIRCAADLDTGTLRRLLSLRDVRQTVWKTDPRGEDRWPEGARPVSLRRLRARSAEALARRRGLE